MHPIEVLKLYETSPVEIVGREIQFEDAEINCVPDRIHSSEYAPFHFMKLQVFVKREKLEAKDRGWEELTEGYVYKLLVFDEDQDLVEALKNEQENKFFYVIYFWPHDAYQELVEEYAETGENYWDEGTGDWSREIDYNSPTIDRLVKMLQEGENDAKNVQMR